MQNYNSKFKSDLKDRCYKFSLAVISLVDTLPNKKAAWIITDQLLRAAMSVGANLIEGSAASSRLEYKKFYEIALKSANETKYWPCLLRDSKIGGNREGANSSEGSNRISKYVSSWSNKVKKKNFLILNCDFDLKII